MEKWARMLDDTTDILKQVKENFMVHTTQVAVANFLNEIRDHLWK